MLRLVDLEVTRTSQIYRFTGSFSTSIGDRRRGAAMLRQVFYHEPVRYENVATHAVDRSDHRTGDPMRCWQVFHA